MYRTLPSQFLFCSSRLPRQTLLAEPLSVFASPWWILSPIYSTPWPIGVQYLHTFFAPLYSPWHFWNFIVPYKNWPSCDAPGLPWFVKVQNTDHRSTFFFPPSNHRKSHMLHVVVLKKDAFQIVEHYLNCPVRGIPQSGVVTPFGGDDLDFNHCLIKIGERFLPGR